ncbi:MAG: hypothetical protein QMD80_00680 [archaeon]|nr:hypothetical protein [archaeon]
MGDSAYPRKRKLLYTEAAAPRDPGTHSTTIVLSEVKIVALPMPMIAMGIKNTKYEFTCVKIKNAVSMITNPPSNVFFRPIKSVRYPAASAVGIPSHPKVESKIPILS